MEKTAKQHRWLGIHIACASLLFAIDAIGFGQGGTTLLITSVFIVRVIFSLVSPKRMFALKRACIYLTALLLTTAYVKFDKVIARSRAETVIAAVERFHSEIGRYPKELNEIVPTYIDKIPPARLTFVFNSFEYRISDQGYALLTYDDYPPFARWSYNFVPKKWVFTD